MPTFSRWMAPPRQPMNRLAAWLLFLLPGALLVTTAAYTGWGKFALGAWLAIWILGAMTNRRQLQRLAAGRENEDIGTFARSFDRRREPFDPHVVRAVWDAFQPYLQFRSRSVPVRATDRIDEDLHIDWDDIDMGLLEEVAQRAGRSLDDLEANPYYGRVSTVGDFVRLVSALRPRSAA